MVKVSELNQDTVLKNESQNEASKSRPKHPRKDPLAWEIGRRLRQAREGAGLTINDVQNLFQWDRQTISTWENGFAFVPIKKLQPLCRLYRVSIDWVVNGNPEDGEWEHHLQALPDAIRDNAIALAERPLVNELTGMLRQMNDEELEKMAHIIPILGKLNGPALDNARNMLSAMFGMLEHIVEDQK